MIALQNGSLACARSKRKAEQVVRIQHTLKNSHSEGEIEERQRSWRGLVSAEMSVPTAALFLIKTVGLALEHTHTCAKLKGHAVLHMHPDKTEPHAHAFSNLENTYMHNRPKKKNNYKYMYSCSGPTSLMPETLRQTRAQMLPF